MSNANIWLVEVTGYTDTAVSSVYRYCAGRDGYITQPTDTPANTYYEPCVIDAGVLKRQMFNAGESGARANPEAQVGYGSITLANIDGHLDTIFDNSAIGWQERQIRILRVQPGAAYSTAVVILVGLISQIEHTSGQVVVGIKDRLYQLNSPHLTTTYGGTNALPAGVDGVADLAGKTIPKIYGKVFQVAALCVNTSRLEYQVSSAAIQSLIAYDGGVALTAGADYVSQVDMETTAPAAGQVRVWPAGGMFRLNATPAKAITVDVVGSTSGNSTAAQIIKQMALDRGISSGDISAADVTALDALNSSVLGIYIDSTATTLECMDIIARSVGAWYAFDRLGVLRMARFDVPSGTALAVVALWNCESVERVANAEAVPTATIRLSYAKYYTPQNRSQLAGAVTDAQASDYAQQWRVSNYTGTISPNPHNRLQIAERETALTTKANADTEALRLFGITGVPRRTHLLKNVYLDSTTLAALDIGAVIELRWNRWGFTPDTGTLRRVIAVTYDYAAERCDLLVWGA